MHCGRKVHTGRKYLPFLGIICGLRVQAYWFRPLVQRLMIGQGPINLTGHKNFVITLEKRILIPFLLIDPSN